MSTYAAGMPAYEARIRRAVLLAATAAAAIHLAAVRAHMMEYRPAGYFMLVGGLLQLAWAVWVIEGAPSQVVAAGVAGNAVIVGLWGVSRTMGLPFGMEPWAPEQIHATDALCTALEVVVILAGVAMLRPGLGMPARWFTVLATTGALLSVLVSSDEPSRERAIPLATLLLIASRPALIILFRRAAAARSTWRSHVQAPRIDRIPVVLDPSARPTLGARW